MTVCPKCDGDLDEDGVCIECGFDTNKEEEKERWEFEDESWKD